MNIRRALRVLGAREVVLPMKIADLLVDGSPFDFAWPVEHVGRVLDALADADQVVLYAQLWQPSSRPGRYRWVKDGIWIELDWKAAWGELVASSRRQCKIAVAGATWPADSIVVPEWIDRSDP